MNHDQSVSGIPNESEKAEPALEGFVTDLMFGSERVPLERVIAARLDGFVSLRGQGLTWRAVAALIARAGGRRTDGKLISADQLRAVVQRLLRRRPAVQARPPPSIRRKHTAPAKGAVSASPAPSRRSIKPPPSRPGTSTDKDVSLDEISAALTRIAKLKV